MKSPSDEFASCYAGHVDALCALLGVDVRLESVGDGGRIIADLEGGLCFTATHPYVGTLDPSRLTTGWMVLVFRDGHCLGSAHTRLGEFGPEHLVKAVKLALASSRHTASPPVQASTATIWGVKTRSQRF